MEESLREILKELQVIRYEMLSNQTHVHHIEEQADKLTHETREGIHHLARNITEKTKGDPTSKLDQILYDLSVIRAQSGSQDPHVLHTEQLLEKMEKRLIESVHQASLKNHNIESAIHSLNLKLARIEDAMSELYGLVKKKTTNRES